MRIISNWDKVRGDDPIDALAIACFASLIKTRVGSNQVSANKIFNIFCY